MPNQIYNQLLLDSLLTEKGATLVGEYNGGGRRTLIQFKCACGEEREKSFCLIKSAGAICSSCVKENQKKILDTGRTSDNILKGLTTRGDPSADDKVFSRSSLEECMTRDKAILVGDYPLLFGHTDINFTCICGKDTILQFQDILGRTKEKREKGYCGALCEKCNHKRWVTARESTNITRYGKKGGINITPETIKKRENTNIIIYGHPSHNMAESVKEKKRITNLDRRGVENPAQCPDVMEKAQKNAKKYKEFGMPSGAIRKVQGYEPFALEALLKAGYTEEQIKTERKDVPYIDYEVDGKKRRYFPDIFIPHEHKIIEVKSTWTYACKTDNIELKKKTCLDAGYLYETWCYDKKGARVDV